MIAGLLQEQHENAQELVQQRAYLKTELESALERSAVLQLECETSAAAVERVRMRNRCAA